MLLITAQLVPKRLARKLLPFKILSSQDGLTRTMRFANEPREQGKITRPSLEIIYIRR